MPERQRADARRNYTRILAVAEEEVATHGADASLEQIARTAGVGSATVRRHFPTRRALLEAVSQKRIEALCVRAHELTGKGDSRNALLEWLDDVVAYSVSARGWRPHWPTTARCTRTAAQRHWKRQQAPCCAAPCRTARWRQASLSPT